MFPLAWEKREIWPTSRRLRSISSRYFFDDIVTAFFRLRGFWLTAPSDAPKFIASRDAGLGDLAGRFLTAATLPERLNFGRDLADTLFKDVPNPARID